MTKSIRDLCPDGKQLILPRALSGSVSINIAALVGMTSPAVSHHLKQLKSSGLLTSRREGKEV